MKKHSLLKFAMASGCIGLLIILIVMLSGVADPHPLFRYGTLVGLALVFAGALAGLAAWLWYLCAFLKNKQYGPAALLAAGGLAVLIKELMRLL